MSTRGVVTEAPTGTWKGDRLLSRLSQKGGTLPHGDPRGYTRTPIRTTFVATPDRDGVGPPLTHPPAHHLCTVWVGS